MSLIACFFFKFTLYLAASYFLFLITRNPSHIASQILHVNQMELKKWLSDAIKKCMGSKTKSQFLPA